jgi:hypothetical protein
MWSTGACPTTQRLFRLEMILMIACCRHSALWALLITLSLPTTALRADTFSALAFDNATVQPAGPRKFSNGKNFFNIEGSNNLPNFASYGVTDFNSSDLLDVDGNMMPSIPTVLNAITIKLTQANAAFTRDGPLNFYLVEDTATSIQPNDVAVFFDADDPAGEGLNGQLAPVHLLGSGTFTQTTSGDPNIFTFPPADGSSLLDDDTITYVLGILTNGGAFRVVITPLDPDVAATFAGFSHTTDGVVDLTGPALTLDVTFDIGPG